MRALRRLELETFRERKVLSKAVQQVSSENKMMVQTKIPESDQSGQQAANVLSEPDATLYLWTLDHYGDLTKQCRGSIFGDRKRRFEDGDTVITSTVQRREGDLIYTRNSIYRLASEEETIALIRAALNSVTSSTDSRDGSLCDSSLNNPSVSS